MSSDPEKMEMVLPERERTPTEKGNEYFQEIKGSKFKKIQRLWDEIKDLIQHVNSGKLKSVTSIESSEQELFEKHRLYTTLSSEFSEFLLRHGDMQEYDAFSSENSRRKAEVEKTYEYISQLKQDIIDNMSVTSSGKQKSATSYSSSALARKQAKVEAARTRLKFLDQEKELMDRQLRLEEEEARIKLDSLRRKKELDIKLTQLSHEKELAVAEAEVEALRSQEEIGGDDDYRLADIPLPEDNRPPSPRSRTKEYVEKHFNNPATYNLDTVPTIPQTAISSDSGASEFAKFLLKKDLLFARLSTFTEEPEAYRSWKGGFNL